MRQIIPFITAAVAACSGSSSDVPPDPDAPASPPDDTEVVDAAAPATVGAARGPSVGVDTLALTGANNAFRTLGDLAVNSQLTTAINSGKLILILEMKDFADPSNDPTVTVEMHNAIDADAMPANNYDANNPNSFIAKTPAQPLAAFSGGVVGGRLQAKAATPIALAGLTIANGELTGALASSNGSISTLNDAKLRGPTTAATLGATAIPANMLPCPGQTLLDVLVRGCAVIPGVQPDTDLDADGLERFADTNNDGRVDRCTDGNGTVFNGTDCSSLPQFADGYLVEMTLHGTRVLFFDPP